MPTLTEEHLELSHTLEARGKEYRVNEKAILAEPDTDPRFDSRPERAKAEAEKAERMEIATKHLREKPASRMPQFLADYGFGHEFSDLLNRSMAASRYVTYDVYGKKVWPED